MGCIDLEVKLQTKAVASFKLYHCNSTWYDYQVILASNFPVISKVHWYAPAS